MRTELDTVLFPNRCDVVELPHHNQWVYLIQKNGNSSLRIQQKRDNLAVFTNEQIATLAFVDVYIREPQARYISGVNTYLQFLQRDHPTLDFATAFWFAKEYKFLNTHYLPQFHWLANLSQYLHSDTKIRFRNFDDFYKIADCHSRAKIVPPTKEFVSDLLTDNKNLELWLHLDRILLELSGKEMTWAQLLQHYQTHHKNIIEHVLPKT